jgi:hypothetical protein
MSDNLKNGGGGENSKKDLQDIVTKISCMDFMIHAKELLEKGRGQ